MKSLTELSKIDKAFDIALTAHNKQYRKVNKTPYIVHPFRVYQRAKEFGLPVDAQIVAMLHDVYEDSKNKNYIADKIRSNFGDTILKYILLLSHDPSINYNEYILNLAKKSSIALHVKLLDMIDNLLDNPSDKQKNKYLSAIKYLLKNDIKINSKILLRILKFLKYN